MTQSTLTLVCATRAACISEAAVAAVAAALRELGATVAAPDWLQPGVACDLGFDGIGEPVAAEGARRVLAGQAIDAVALPVAGRRKRLLVADMESTVIGQEMLDELGELAGIGDRIAGITARAMNGEIDFPQAFRERAGMLAGMPLAALEMVWLRVTVTDGARELVATMQRHGGRCLLVSGGLRFFTSRVAAQLGFDSDQGNAFEIVDGRLTGRVIDPILGRDSKRVALLEACERYGLAPADAVAVGDGANDVDMMETAGLGIAFHAKPAVAARVPHRIDHADLAALLFIQGYRATDIVS